MKQYYSQSKSILTEIKKANNILINIHRNPDLDSIGSATALYQVLLKLGKKVSLVCPHKIPENFKFLKGADSVQTINFKTFFSTNRSRPVPTIDLFLILDSGSYDVVTGDKEIMLPKINKIIIDHHRTNNWPKYLLRLLDVKSSSTCEVIYKLFLDWGIKIDSDTATSIFSGVASDTVFFKYGENAKKTFKIAADLLKLGADNKKLVNQVLDNMDFGLVKTIGELLTKMKKETSSAGQFIYSILDNETFVKLGKHRGAREMAANLFARSIKDCDFGIMAVEYEKNKFAVSFRSKSNTDVSIIARKLGGGGHKNAAGATVYGKIDQIIKKILRVALPF